MSIVISNFVGFFPTLQTLYYTCNKHYMIHEFLFFYLITFNSGSYHLCNKLNYKGNYCNYLPEIVFVQLDYINSYFCIIATILYLVKFEFINDVGIKNMIKFTIYLIDYIIVSILTLKYRTTQIPALFTSLSLLILLLIFVVFKNKYIELYFTSYRICIFLVGFAFSTIAFVTYLYISINSFEGEEKYWIYHSYMWHVPVMIAPVFIIESATIAKKSFFACIFDFFNSQNVDQSIRNLYLPTEVEMI